VHDLRILDHPDPRRVHRRPTARGGGIAVALAFLVVGGGLVAVGGAIPGMPGLRGVTPANLLGLFGGAVLAVVIGALDDRFDLRARWQFLGQLALAAVAVVSGVVVDDVSTPFGPGNLDFPTAIAIAFTVVWIVGMINSLNFIDGLDGLSTGIALIAAVVLGVLSLSQQVNQPLVAVLCFALAGGLLGFLRWNFHPASIFQGTAGVMFVGYALAVLAVLGSAKVVVALLVLAVPIIDTFWVIVRRLSSRRSPFSPDRGHIHHRLLDLGLSHRATVLLIYAVCATLGLMSLLVSSATGVFAFIGALVVFGVAAFALRRDARTRDSSKAAS
ncbi:MAG TPA: MraY family glycosyltransferase, partial [Candidatus Limnocylindrales bacterium]|nr:MraY family glycosyltransferase [Candidatus Limnocylindrales bacterium]